MPGMARHQAEQCHSHMADPASDVALDSCHSRPLPGALTPRGTSSQTVQLAMAFGASAHQEHVILQQQSRWPALPAYHRFSAARIITGAGHCRLIGMAVVWPGHGDKWPCSDGGSGAEVTGTRPTDKGEANYLSLMEGSSCERRHAANLQSNDSDKSDIVVNAWLTVHIYA